MKSRIAQFAASHFACTIQATVIYVAGAAITWLGIAFGAYAVAPIKPHCLAESFAGFDGQNYKDIHERGYSYTQFRPSNVAFFPLYPLTSRYVALITGASSTASLLVVAHLALLAASVLFARYAHDRLGRSAPSENQSQLECSVSWSIVIFGLLPTTFFWRCAYSESLFVLLELWALWLIHRGSSPFRVAAVAGIASATRPVGIALLLPLAWHCWHTFVGKERWLNTGLCLVLGASGLLFYMTFLEWQFGDSLSFARTQSNFYLRPAVDIREKMVALLSLEPLWAIYVPGSAASWKEFDRLGLAPVSLQFMNTVWFLGMAIVVFFGAKRKWLTRPETLLAAGLLLIPYVTRSYEMCMASQGRYATVVIPAYLVLGRMFASLPLAVSAAVVALFGFLLGIYAAQFAAGYLMI